MTPISKFITTPTNSNWINFEEFSFNTGNLHYFIVKHLVNFQKYFYVCQHLALMNDFILEEGFNLHLLESEGFESYFIKRFVAI